MKIILFSFIFFLINSVLTEPLLFFLDKEWTFRSTDSKEFLKAKVPGCVHLDLLENKIIDDPFFGNNSLNLDYLEHKHWEYKNVFDVDQSILNQTFVDIIFEALDTHTEITLNNVVILKTDNAFRYLKEKNNTLLINFFSTIEYDSKKRAEISPIVI